MTVVIKDVTTKVKDIKRRELAQQHKTHEPRHNDIQATVKSLNGSTSPAARPGKTWVSFHNEPGSLQDVWNPTSLSTAETHVWVGPSMSPPYALEIKGPYQGGVDPSTSFPTSGGPSGTTDHGHTHQLANESSPGSSPTLVYQPMLQPLKTTASTSNLMVFTMAHTYFYGGRRVAFLGKYQTMESYVPSASLSRRVLFYLNPVLNQVEYVAGATVVTGAAPVPYPEIPAGMYPSAYVNLVGEQTSINTANHIEDARDFLRPRSADGSDHSLYDQSDGLHSPFRWVWADSWARYAETDVSSYDVSNYTVGLQLDTGERFRASDTSPTWVSLDPNTHFLYRSITNHTDGPWYSLYIDDFSEKLPVPADTAWQVVVNIVGKTSPTFAQHWMYWGLGGVVNHSGTVTADFTAYGGGIGAVWESDSGYEAQVIADDANNALDVQIRRNGGVNWYIDWKAKLTITPITFS